MITIHLFMFLALGSGFTLSLKPPLSYELLKNDKLKARELGDLDSKEVEVDLKELNELDESLSDILSPVLEATQLKSNDCNWKHFEKLLYLIKNDDGFYLSTLNYLKVILWRQFKLCDGHVNQIPAIGGLDQEDLDNVELFRSKLPKNTDRIPEDLTKIILSFMRDKNDQLNKIKDTKIYQRYNFYEEFKHRFVFCKRINRNLGLYYDFMDQLVGQLKDPLQGSANNIPAEVRERANLVELCRFFLINIEDLAEDSYQRFKSNLFDIKKAIGLID